MAKIYWTKEVKAIMTGVLHQMTDALIADEEMSLENEAEEVARIRHCRKFADEVIAEMEELDRKDDEEMAAREKKKAEMAAAEVAQDG